MLRPDPAQRIASKRIPTRRRTLNWECWPPVSSCSSKILSAQCPMNEPFHLTSRDRAHPITNSRTRARRRVVKVQSITNRPRRTRRRVLEVQPITNRRIRARRRAIEVNDLTPAPALLEQHAFRPILCDRPPLLLVTWHAYRSIPTNQGSCLQIATTNAAWGWNLWTIRRLRPSPSMRTGLLRI